MRTAMIPIWSLAASDLADAEPCDVPDSLQGLQVCKVHATGGAAWTQPAGLLQMASQQAVGIVWVVPGVTMIKHKVQ